MDDSEKFQLPYFIDLNCNSDSRGTIHFSEYGALPFAPARFFFLTPSSTLSARGEHGHKWCWQIIFPVDDSITVVSVTNGNVVQYDITLGRALVIPPKNWCKVLFNSENSIAVALASHEYDPEDYFYTQMEN